MWNQASLRGPVDNTPTSGALVPRYVTRYKILDLLKLQFSKEAKSMRKKFFGLMKRPELIFKTNLRFSSNYSNREFRRKWHKAGKGPFHASDHKKLTILTARPSYGPLVKAAKYLRKKELQGALRAKERAVKVRDVHGPSSGPLPPYRGSEYSNAHVQNRNDGSSKSAPKKPKHVRNFRADRVLMMTHGVEGVPGSFSGPVGGIRLCDTYFTKPPPRDTWKKYWYFYRTYGHWHPSEHHPYDDEIPIITNWLKDQVNPG